tara:strand:+ start:1261 stop:1434 length:174 start_codon:yes stop_codon:yes gene_type:complete
MIGSKLVYRNGKVGVVENTYLIGDDAMLVYVVFEIDTGSRVYVTESEVDRQVVNERR